MNDGTSQWQSGRDRRQERDMTAREKLTIITAALVVTYYSKAECILHPPFAGEMACRE
jgi:hypothetical protein